MKRKIELDELDKKCLEEMSLILEVLSSTSGKIEKLLASYYKDMKEAINKNLPSGWIVKPKSKHTKDISIDNIEVLSNYYSIDGQIHIEKENEVENFHSGLGYYCSIDEGYNCFSFYIQNIQPSKPLKFYEKIQELLKDTSYEIVIEHPSIYDDKRELIEIRVNMDVFSIEKLDGAYNVFKDTILNLFLKDLK